MSESRWWNYVTSTAGNVQNTEIADRVGIDKSNVTRWSKGSRPAVEFVLKFARAYGQPVIAALAASEYITDLEAGIREVKIGVSDLTETELAEELLERVKSRASASNVSVGRFGQNVDPHEVDLSRFRLAGSEDDTTVSEQQHNKDEDISQDPED